MRLALTVLAAVSASSILWAPSSGADACVGGPIKLMTKAEHLAPRIPFTAHSDGCTSFSFDATASAKVRVGGRMYRAHSFKLVAVTTTYQRFDLRTPRRSISDARAYAQRRHLRYAYLYIRLRGHTREDGQAIAGSYGFRLQVR